MAVITKISSEISDNGVLILNSNVACACFFHPRSDNSRIYFSFTRDIKFTVASITDIDIAESFARSEEIPMPFIGHVDDTVGPVLNAHKWIFFVINQSIIGNIDFAITEISIIESAYRDNRVLILHIQGSDTGGIATDNRIFSRNQPPLANSRFPRALIANLKFNWGIIIFY